VNGERRTSNAERPEGDSSMKRSYVGVLVLEAVIIAALWAFGRAFA
jgi:hypothetical protein